MTALCSMLITKFTARSERCRKIADQINLLQIVCEKLDMSLAVMQNYRHLETTKKNGVQKVSRIFRKPILSIKFSSYFRVSSLSKTYASS